MKQKGIGKAPSHLVKHRHLFYFRVAIPADLKPILAQSEIRLSLRTSYLTEARAKANRLSLLSYELFNEIRKGDEGIMAGLTDDKIREIVQQNLARALEESETERIQRKTPLKEDQLDAYLFSLSDHISSAREELALSDYRQVSRHASDLLSEWNIPIDINSLAFKKLCRELLKSSITRAEIDKKRAIGDYSDEVQLEHSSTREASKKAQKGAPSPKLSEVVQEYIEEKRQLGSWDSKSLNGIIPMLEQFVELVGDVPIWDLKHQHIRNYKNKLMKFPANRKKKRAYRDKSIEELLQMDIPQEDIISNTTLANIFNKVSSFIIWSKQNGYISDDSIKDLLRIKSKKQAHQYRDIFSRNDLVKLFSSKEYLEGNFNKPHKYWVPLLALFTGARIEEICQLHIEDVYQEEGIWCIDINDFQNKSLKNSSSKRIIPVHDVLVQSLDFPGFVDQMKAQGSDLVFPELRPKPGSRFSDNVSKWFNRYKQYVGIQKGNNGKKDFHSFRHTLSNWCDQNNIPEKKAARLLGHNHGNITYGRYSKETSPSALYHEIIKKLDFGIDLSRLKKPF